MKIVGLLVVLGYLVGTSYGSTIGFVGAAGVNANIPTTYGSNIAADGTGWTVSDGSGATPNIALEWSDGNDPGDWEFHNAGSFTFLEANSTGGTWDANPGNAVCQLQSAPTFINFSVDAGQALVLNSVDVGHASDQIASHGTYGYILNLVRDSDSAMVWTGSSSVVGAAGADVAETAAETVAINYTGAVGEDYTLTFTRYDEGDPGSGSTAASGIDNLSFSQIPEPATLGLLGFVVCRACPAAC